MHLRVLFFLFIPFITIAQKSEFGFGIGVFNYTGDLARTYTIANSQPAGAVFYRSNVSRVVSFRTTLTAGKIGASDSRPIDALSTARKASFNLFLYEVAIGTEYHFLDWRNESHPLRFSPYTVLGVGLFGMVGIPSKSAEYSNIQPSVQVGMGIKYIINPLWYLGLEFGMRKTFFDHLDNISASNYKKKNYQYGNPIDNDNYFFTGITLTRTFYNIPCPRSPYKR